MEEVILMTVLTGMAPAVAEGYTGHAVDPHLQMLMERMVCAEGKGVSRTERVAVAWVAMNRAARPSWWGRDLGEVLLRKDQFATWHPMCAAELPGEWSSGARVLHRKRMLEIQEDVLGVMTGAIKDPTRGATYFHLEQLPVQWPELVEIPVPENWAHRFFWRPEDAPVS